MIRMLIHIDQHYTNVLKVYERQPVEIRELKPEETEEGLRFRNTNFNDIPREHWDAMNCTAVIARENDRIVGLIPLQYRRQLLRPGVEIPVVYENAVGVAEEVRSRGIGTEMLDVAGRFMKDRVDALFVIRSGERTNGYRFYRKTVHGDICYAREFRKNAAEILNGAGRLFGTKANRRLDIRSVTPEEWNMADTEKNRLYGLRYGEYGGGRVREAGYWPMVIRSHVYRGRFKLFLHARTEAGDLCGYLLALAGDRRDPEGLFVCESAGTHDAVTALLIREAACVIGSHEIRFPSVTLEDPITPVLTDLGFMSQESEPQIMCRILRADRIFGTLAAGSDLIDTIDFSIRTPHRDIIVNRPDNVRYEVRMEMKEHLVSRLFTSRLDLQAAVDMEMVRVKGADSGLIRQLSEIFRYTGWAQTYSDYV